MGGSTFGSTPIKREIERSLGLREPEKKHG